MDDLKKQVIERVNLVMDLETGKVLGQLNVVTDVVVEEEGIIRIPFTPISPYSPTAYTIGMEIRKAAESVQGVKKVQVVCEGHMQDDIVNRLVNSIQE